MHRENKGYKALGRKGSLADIIYGALVLTVLAIVILLVYYFLGELVTPLSDAIGSEGLGVEPITNAQSALVAFNTGFVFITLAIGVVCMISSFFINSHPIFFVFSLFFNVIVVFMVSLLSNIYYQFTLTEELATVMGNFAVMDFIMVNLPQIMLMISVLIGITLYAKERW